MQKSRPKIIFLLGAIFLLIITAAFFYREQIFKRNDIMENMTLRPVYSLSR